MQSYTKLFSSIVTSTIWMEDDSTRIVWITMLAIADKHGEVHASLPGLARVAGVTLDEADKAIQKFLGPDPHSRTKTDDGKRIEVIDGGWLLINHAKYRALASSDDQRVKTLERVRRHRQRQARNGGVTGCNDPVTQGNDPVTVDTGKAESKDRCISDAEALDQEEGHITSETAPQPAKSPGARKARPAPSPEEIIKRYSNDQTYKGIDVAREYGKWQNWCLLHRKQPTERRFVAWLNRIDPPVVGVVRPRNTDPNI